MPIRVFAAINLTPEAAHAIQGKVDDLKIKLPVGVRFLPSSNWHITISFLGYQDEDSVFKILEALKETVSELQAPEIVFNKLIFGPAGRTPRMIWLTTTSDTSERLSKIKLAFEDRVKNSVNFKMEDRAFNGHITLARFRGFEQGTLPGIDEKFDLKFTPRTLDLMESRLERGGALYSVLQRFEFSY